jgi:hypothetical protein
MNTYIVLRRSGWANQEELERAASRSSRVVAEMPGRVRWMRSYITSEPASRVGTICVYQATGVEAVRAHALRAGLPCDSVIPVSAFVVINEDEEAVVS